MLLWAKRRTRPPNNFFADTATVNANGYETLLASGLSTFFIKGNPVLVTVLKFYLNILLSVLFYAISVLDKLRIGKLRIYLQKLYEVSKVRILFSCELGNFTFKVFY